MRSTVTVWKGGTYLRITDYKAPFVQDVIMPFCRRRLYRLGKVPIPGTRQKRTVVTHSFARMNNDRSEFRISAGLLEDFIQFMEGVGYKEARVKIKDEPVIKGKDVEFKWKEGWGEPRPHQVDWCEYQLQDGPVKVNNAQTGDGKAQPLYSKVLTPHGFVKMGDVRLGDEVIAKDGTPSRVTGVYPQGLKPIHKVLLSDDRVIECADEHLWTVYHNDEWKTLQAQEIRETLRKGERYHLPLFVGNPISQAELDRISTKPTYEERSDSFEHLIKIRDLFHAAGGTASVRRDRGTWLLKATRYTKDPKALEIVDITISGKTEMQCIEIDHPEHLYVTDRYVVTHNTFMATHTMVNTGKRTLITCLPRYTSIWFESLGAAVELNPEDIMLVGNGKIEEAAETIKSGRADPKIIILPLTRYDTYLKREREEDIPCLDEVFTDMEIGFRIMDEAHEDIYRVYMSMLFGNFEKTIALSATLKADDPFVNDIYRYVYPYKMRLKEPEYKKYIDVIAYHHYIDMQKYRINTKGFGGYSHVKYEQAIMKTPKLYLQYLELCKQAFEEFYVNDHKEGQKCLWFFSTVEMATRMKEDFEKAYPDMDIWKFTNAESKNKETEMSYMEHQVVFTTPQSCGTGKDIPDLAVAFSPYACSSRQRNDQMLGRTRPLKNYPGDSPKFVYFVCTSIPKQKEYHQKRKELFAVKSKTHKNINSFHHIV